MVDISASAVSEPPAAPVARRLSRIAPVPATTVAAKRVADLVVGGTLLLPMALFAAALLLLNPFLNRGPLLYSQYRMGQDCRRIRVWKFRSMTPAGSVPRGPFDPLDVARITPLGRFLRRSRIDELPQVLNVLRGEMSLIGPRPDYYDHACHYLRVIPGYVERHAVRPGISGLAQTEVGYVDGLDGVRRKVAADIYYIRNASIRLELWILWRTLQIVLQRKGL